MRKIKNKIQFANELSNWYRLNKRNLPFRKTNDPYKIYLSEMMLQQTQMDTVLPYYERFISKYPTITELANAPMADVLKLWEGLGYYRRAAYLHETAKIVRDEHNGVFPSDIESIRKLKGIGRYTAGAIHSIAFLKPTPAVDGNVMRVMSRITAYDKDITKTTHMREIENEVQTLIIHENPSDFTQGMMELGALVCQKTPKCEWCPVSKHCFAFNNNQINLYPYKEKAKAKVTEEYIVFVVMDDASHVLLNKRPGDGLLANMLEFPQFETKDLKQASIEFMQTYNVLVTETEKLFEIKHIFTHKIWLLNVYKVSVQTNKHLNLIPTNDIPTAMSKAHIKILEKLKK
ncbi:A/G-specific adenine glycosylase [Liberiplasma polymorphum]|uniref:A/G-specific adenine glycosylase n=1 Tax=Liberiplasma polymorphum TaxID=3374570 RepID=UPI003774AE25